MNAFPSDKAEALEIEIQRVLNGRVRNLHVEVQETGITLRGSANTFYAKQLAQQMVQKASGCRVAANEIDVM
jgi:osmotically-inducible protein OsmY